MTICIESVKALLFENDEFSVDTVDIYIRDDRIVKINRRENPAASEQTRAEYAPDRIIDGKFRLAIPGLVNSHTHAYMTMFRNKADDVPFTQWLFDTILPLEDAMSPQECYYGTLLANAEMIRTGTTSYIDMHLTPDSNARAATDSGLRVCLSRGLTGNDRKDEDALRRLKEAMHDHEHWCDNDMITTMLAPHAPYTCGPDYLEYIASYAKEHGFALNIHLAEGDDEMENIRKTYGMTPIEYADRAGVFDVRTVAAHCVHLSDSDMDILKEKKVHVAVNPISNMKLGNGFSPVPEMLEKGISVCIGTDGAASNNSLNLFREMTTEALIHKGLKKDTVCVRAADVLKMATIGGAAAMGREGELGRIEEGYKADIVLLDMRSPQLIPDGNLISALVYSCCGNEVDTVMVNGKI